MRWLFQVGSTRKELIAERVEGWERQAGEMLVKSTCVAHCLRGGRFSGVLWSVWQRTFEGGEARPTERWIQCDLLSTATRTTAGATRTWRRACTPITILVRSATLTWCRSKPSVGTRNGGRVCGRTTNDEFRTNE